MVAKKKKTKTNKKKKTIFNQKNRKTKGKY